MLPPRAKHCLTKIPVWAWNPFLQIALRRVQEAVAAALGHLPKLEGETQLLKTPHALDTGLGRYRAGTDLETSLPRTSSPGIQSCNESYRWWGVRQGRAIESPAQR